MVEEIVYIQDIESVGFKIISDYCGLVLYKEDCADGSQVRLNILTSKIPDNFIEIGYAFTIIDKRVKNRMSFAGLIDKDFFQSLEKQEEIIRDYILKQL